ncbi:MAG: branched-chain amino acid ABC transporter permease, partial [bacterium]
IIIFLVLLILLPFIANDYMLYVLNLIGISIIGAIGMNILTGFTGLISLGHAAFIGIGAYGTSILSMKLGLPFILALPAGASISAIFGVIIGIPSLRVKGLYLLVATLAFQIIFEYLLFHLTFITGGREGITVKSASLFGMSFSSEKSFFYLILVLVVLSIIFATNVFRTNVGRAFIAIRDRDIAAELVGINVFKFKLLAFGLSSFYAGIAGGLWAYHVNSISPEHFPLWLSIRYIAMVIIGGLGSRIGAIFGAAFVILIPEVLSAIASLVHLDVGVLSSLQQIVFGMLIILFLIVEPDGLAELWSRIKKYWKLWPYSY